jgi:hypothetical protein
VTGRAVVVRRLPSTGMIDSIYYLHSVDTASKRSTVSTVSTPALQKLFPCDVAPGLVKNEYFGFDIFKYENSPGTGS